MNVIDATRTSDGKLVYIKKIRPDSQELELMRYLSSPELLQDPHNHCVPLLDVIYDPSDPETCFIVMPYLRYISYPPFELVEDMLECIDQILEVGVTRAERTIAHGSTVGTCLLARPWRGSPVSTRGSFHHEAPLLTLNVGIAPTRIS